MIINGFFNRFVTSTGWPAATLLATGRTDVQSFTSEFEIFRGSLAKIFMNLIEPKVKIIFNETIESYTENGDGVTVTFAKSKAVEKFDLLVAADGTGSKIRAKMIDSTAPLQKLWEQGLPTAYFTIKKDLLNGGKLAKWYTAPGGRSILLRPDSDPRGCTRAIIMHIPAKGDVKLRERLVTAMKSGNEDFMTVLEELYGDAGWLSKEVLEGMRGSDDFYCSMFGHVRSPTLQDGRVVLLGDAGYATPGIGTSLAIIGGYVLAGELLRKEGDVKDAVKGYEDIMVPFIKKLGADDGEGIHWVNPQSWWGIVIRNTILGIVTRLRLDRLGVSVVALMGWKDDKIKMPDYQWPDELSEAGKDTGLLAEV